MPILFSSRSIAPPTSGSGGAAPTQVMLLLQGGDTLGENQNNTSTITQPNHQTIGWKGVPGATSYNIYRNVNQAGYSLYASGVSASTAASNYSTYAASGASYSSGQSLPSTSFTVGSIDCVWQDTAATSCTQGPNALTSGQFAPSVTGFYSYKVSAVVSGVESALSSDNIIPMFVNGARVFCQEVFNNEPANWAATVPGANTPLGYNTAVQWNATAGAILINPYAGVGCYEYNLNAGSHNYMNVNLYTGSSGGPFTFELGPECWAVGNPDYALLNTNGYLQPELSLTAGSWLNAKIPLGQYLVNVQSGATFTGSISGNTLSTSGASGTIAVGQWVIAVGGSGISVAPAQITVSLGGGQYTLSGAPQTVSSGSMGSGLLQWSYYKTTIKCDQASLNPVIYLEWYFTVN